MFPFLSLLRPLTSQSPTKDSTYVPEVPSQIGTEYTYLNMYFDVFLIVHHIIELFHLPTLLHNSLFINNMYVTLLSSCLVCVLCFCLRSFVRIFLLLCRISGNPWRYLVRVDRFSAGTWCSSMIEPLSVEWEFVVLFEYHYFVAILFWRYLEFQILVY